MRAGRDFLVSEPVVIAAILINAAALLGAASLGEGEPACRFCEWVDYACAVFFVIEAALKIQRDGWRGYWSSGWNRFDFTIVALSLPVLIKPLGIVDTQAFAVFLTLRLGRLFRLFRLLKFIPNREHMLIGIRRALKASVGVFIAILIVNAVLAIGGSMLFGRWAPEHFGNPLLSIYTTFKVFTVEGWYEIPDLLARRADSDLIALVARVYFVGAVLVGGILGLSLANAVFVDEMTMDNTERLEDQIEQLLGEVRSLREQLDPRESSRPPPEPGGEPGSEPG
ncbi:MAG: ion transporter [Polyangia bacterium]